MFLFSASSITNRNAIFNMCIASSRTAGFISNTHREYFLTENVQTMQA